MDPTPAPLIPQEGWHCLHLFYRIEYGQWQLLNPTEQRAAKIALSTLVQETRALTDTQLLTLSQVTPKADLGFMLITPDLQIANRIEKQLTLSLGAGYPRASLQLSLPDRGERIHHDRRAIRSDPRDRAETHAATPEFEAAMQDFRERMKKYRQDRVYPTLPDWPVVCFYNMTKRRGEQHNWYSLPFEERRTLMGGHARVGRQYAGKVKQLITGSTGLDDAEWGVTLFAHDTFQIKAIVYQMRFDEVSAAYADFGEFYIGIQLPLDELFRRLQL